MGSIIVAATQNKGKIREIEAITSEFGMTIIPRDEADIPNIEIVEDVETFEENSYKKAYEIMKLCGKPTIADDSGIMIDYLEGAPGVYSARFAGEECDDDANNAKMLRLLEGVPYEKRTAKYVAVITLIYPDGETLVARGEIHGHIMLEAEGSNGFGYDPYFQPDGYEHTFGVIDPETKNKISHRANALIKLRQLLLERENA